MSKIPAPPVKLSQVEKVFGNELKLIRSKEIKKFVIDVFEKLCPDYFWTVPCSTSGKYHPALALGKGGLIRHVRLAVYWGLELARAFELEKYQDEIVATLLLHDLIKNGKGLDSKGFPLERGVTGTHGVTLAYKIKTEALDINLDKTSALMIFDGIACHMGIWTTDSIHRPCDKFTDLIHLADYCASRKVDEQIKKLEQEKSEENNAKTT